MKRYALIGVIAAGLLLAGCTSAAKQQAAAPVTVTVASIASSTPAPTSSSSPADWSVATAQANYLAYVAPGNASIDVLNKAVKASPTSLPAVLAACATLVTSSDTLARQISAGMWPANAKTAAAGLVAGLSKERLGYQQCSSSTTVVQAVNNLNTMYLATTDAQTMRIALGLPGTS